MKLIIKFILLLFITSNVCLAQFTLHRDSILWTRSLHIGCDISRFLLPVVSHGQSGIEVSSDVRLTPNLYPTVELGEEVVNFSNNFISQSANGQYMRLGCDINLRNITKDFSNNIIFIGFRYGIGNVNYKLNNYTIQDTVWGNQQGSTGNIHTYAQWMEGIAGVRVEVVKNIFFGWSVRGKILLGKTHNSTFPYIIPGYGYGENSSNVGINYSIYYQIPFMKMKTRYKAKKKPQAQPTKKPTPNTLSP